VERREEEEAGRNSSRMGRYFGGAQCSRSRLGSDGSSDASSSSSRSSDLGERELDLWLLRVDLDDDWNELSDEIQVSPSLSDAKFERRFQETKPKFLEVGKDGDVAVAVAAVG
jgi:hypothetical protein